MSRAEAWSRVLPWPDRARCHGHNRSTGVIVALPARAGSSPPGAPVRWHAESIGHCVALAFCLSAALYGAAAMLLVNVPRWHPPVGESVGVLIDLAVLGLSGAALQLVCRFGADRPAATTPHALSRNAEVWLLGAVLCLFFMAWQPLPALLWSSSAPPWRIAGWIGGAAGCLAALLCAADAMRPRSQRGPRPGARLALSRPGIICGLLAAEWCAPRMTLGHLLFAVGLSAYLACFEVRWITLPKWLATLPRHLRRSARSASTPRPLAAVIALRPVSRKSRSNAPSNLKVCLTDEDHR